MVSLTSLSAGVPMMPDGVPMMLDSVPMMPDDVPMLLALTAGSRNHAAGL